MPVINTENIGQTFWKGIVKVDVSINDYASNFQDYPQYKHITISDQKYANKGIVTDFYIKSDIFGTGNIPSYHPIHVWIVGKQIQEFMMCSAVMLIDKVAHEKGVFKKTTVFEDKFAGIGYILEPTTEHNTSPVPCLASYRGSSGDDNSITIHQKGIVAFFTASRSAMDSDAARKSLTAVFIASDQNPFTATVRKKGKTFDMKFGNAGLVDDVSEDKGKASQKRTTKSTEDPLAVLKLRLAKGEITTEHYEQLKRVLES